MPKLTIDGKEIEVPAGFTVIQACEQAGVEIPRFCYHERLAIAGNCRMCLVEVAPGPPKPQASCALPVAEGMAVKTNTPMVKKAREGVMEFLLINHPLDCPICDQGGECDLQDQAMAYGAGFSRYREGKRAVEDKYLGPLVKTEMNRCIHCTRCIRFMSDVAGVPELGAIGRGEHMEITNFLEHALGSELSGNIVDLCPVGALTSKPYAFLARPWELSKTESIDVMDAVGSNIRVDSRGGTVLRVLPRLHEDINEEWISDKTRHACDGLGTQRLDRPYVRRNGALKEASWPEAFAAIAARLKNTAPDRIAAIAGNLANVESVFALKELMDGLGSPHRECRQDGARFPTTSRGDYLFNTTIAGVEQADVVLIIGANLRKEAPILNARLRKNFLRKGLRAYYLGPETEHTFPVQWLGNTPHLLNEILSGSHGIAEALRGAKNPLLILGMGALARPDGETVYATARRIADTYNIVRDGWNGFSVLHNAASRVGALDVGFLPAAGGKDMQGILDGAQCGDIEVVYLLGADEFDMEALGKAFVIYQGHHGDAGAHRADVILPGAAYTEQDALFVNTEGRPQLASRAVFPPGEAKEDWAILRALSEALGRPLSYNTLGELRRRLVQAVSHVGAIDTVQPNSLSAASVGGSIAAEPFAEAIRNFYMTDPISRASKTMALCTQEVPQLSKEAA